MCSILAVTASWPTVPEINSGEEKMQIWTQILAIVWGSVFTKCEEEAEEREVDFRDSV